MYCNLSGQECEEPVVSRKTGHLFEKRLIEKYIKENGTCPITGEPMSEDELLPIKTNKTVKARPVAATSIPGMLSLFQNEWDALMLETYTLKQHLDTVRQELSHALYQHDAACRVIARLIKERDAARAALANAHVAVPEDHSMEVESQGITADIVKKLIQTSESLSAHRKKRKTSPSVATVDDVKSYKQTSSYPLHKASDAGISCIDVHHSKNLALTGGVDANAILFNRDTKKTVATLSGHSGRINDVLFHPTMDVVFTASADHTARIFALGDNDEYRTAHVLRGHKGEVTGAALHATGDYLVTSSLDKTWAFHDISTGTCLTSTDASEAGYTCASFHPDGLILATGTSDNVIRVWDVKSQENVATFKGHTDTVNALSFSENGYYLATCSNDGAVKLWDLRKLSNFHTIQLDSPVNSVRFDYSGSYLAAASSDVRVFQSKVWSELVKLTDHSDVVTDVAFGADAKFLASSSMDGSLKFFA